MPTWIGGAGALAAGWFAFQTIKSQRQQIGEQQAFIAEQTRFMDEQRQNLELERRELRAAAEDRRSAQARQVQMIPRQAGATTDREGNDVAADHWVVTVQNDSDAPVSDVDVRFGSAYLASEVYEVPASRRGPEERRPRPLHLLGAGRTARFYSQRWQPTTVHNNRPTLLFTDSDGVRWSLDYYGKLEEAPADGAS
ncbi:hypothetical protein [Streptomyces rochei]|uniref:hypothetical protein n=1 Tax=Streptomyces rochei TaxID=1928 RepID=UPI0013BB22DA|nr:hypothetical protein [Streptomyces rochei]NEC76470.1 hypothetical protein [Streptomyces rochei]